ncbi:hypothetical protein SAMN02745751_01126 [Dethiosulfatibacter aminovorans DSM 17477]|uniref:Polymerase/histidinol phosphatase N-terminal domain-containing protein n=1 Tax=Dethiosulfatibacter aminovorans DSM 17477 TaxID=1121476 RepID=A0A1M6EA82_9FIRM|nr:PHP domain-containing protein [Dethiosulfatibacter aminovorans]SHI82361.1 hypothetical protein SAMN02745751_01126 [Dethiosulfatibacter aminovorans DSM 17477]
MIDLHVHSNLSDGTDTIDELLDIAESRNVSEFALTDHDTVLGVEDIIKKGMKRNIKVIPGIELSTFSNGLSIHILGYMIDWKNSQLLDFINITNKHLREFSLGMMTRLKKDGVIDFSPDRVEELKTYKDAIYLSDLMKSMIHDGYQFKLEDWPKFFADTFGKYKMPMTNAFPWAPEDAVEIITAAGGVSSFAHPARIGNADIKEMERLLPHGLNGVEVFYPYHDETLMRKYIDFCRANDLLKTGGTDWHGKFTYWDSKLGQYGVRDSKLLYEYNIAN